MPINPDMDVSSVSGNPSPEAINAQRAASREIDRTALVLKKLKDVQEAQAQALVQLVQQAGTGRLIDARA
jgi:hypothetical protein